MRRFSACFLGQFFASRLFAPETANIGNYRDIAQANRAMCHLDVSDRRGYGL
jgi:hypothetical protein